MNTRIFLRVLWAIFALVAPFAISHPFGLIGGLLLLPQSQVGLTPKCTFLSTCTPIIFFPLKEKTSVIYKFSVIDKLFVHSDTLNLYMTEFINNRRFFL